MYKSTDLILKEKNIRPTQIRREILRLFSSADYALSHADINMFIGADFDAVTIYRTLNTFEKKGILHSIQDSNKSTRYALCSNTCDEQHHEDKHAHFHCSSCNQIYCMEESYTVNSTVPEGFQENSSSHTIYGTCKTCNSNN